MVTTTSVSPSFDLEDLSNALIERHGEDEVHDFGGWSWEAVRVGGAIKVTRKDDEEANMLRRMSDDVPFYAHYNAL